MFLVDNPSKPESDKSADDRDEAIYMVDVPIIEAPSTATTSTVAAPSTLPIMPAPNPSTSTQTPTITTQPTPSSVQEATLKDQSDILKQLDVISTTTTGLVK